MKAVIKTKLNLPAIDAWHKVKQSQTLLYVCKGLLGFDSSNFPEQWQAQETVNTRLYFFGIIPAWRHSLYFKTISDDEKIQFTQEHGGLVKTWDHKIHVEEIDQDNCIYSDTIEIKAGIFTPFVWAFANVLYRYRQRRWKKIIAITQA